jgi:hypothetical protein
MRHVLCSTESVNLKEILGVLAALDVEAVAAQEGYCLRRRKLPLTDQVGLWLTARWGGGDASLSTLALRRQQTNGDDFTLTEQALSKDDCERPWELFRDVFVQLASRADRRLRRWIRDLEINILDASVIKGLAPSLARFFPLLSNGGALLARAKMHVLWNPETGSAELKITDANNNDGQHKDFIWPHLRRNQLLLFDLGYWDFRFLDHIHGRKAFFVTRVFPTNRPQVLEVFRWTRTFRDYRAKLDRYPHHPKRYAVRVIEQRQADGTWWRWCTNLMDLERYPAEAIIALYARRWEVEVFFRLLKHVLGLKHLRSRNPNAVLVEIYLAFLAYLVVHWLVAEAARRYPLEPRRRYCLARAAALLGVIAVKLRETVPHVLELIAEHCTMVLNKERQHTRRVSHQVA